MRLDVYLTDSGVFESRSKAAAAIKAGAVTVNGKTADKASFSVDGSEKIEVLSRERFVSRAGEKLEKALNEFGISPEGMTVLDIGASTGGFTDCLLQNGAKRVFALDVGTAQLAEKLRNDCRVTVMEGFNARSAGKSDFPVDIDMIVMDVSFISQTLIYPACADILEPGRHMITLVKPQFEAGKSNIGKGGIVRDKDGRIIMKIMKKLDFDAEANGLKRIGFTDSPIEGGDGNREYLALFIKQERVDPE